MQHIVDDYRLGDVVEFKDERDGELCVDVICEVHIRAVGPSEFYGKLYERGDLKITRLIERKLKEPHIIWPAKYAVGQKYYFKWNDNIDHEELVNIDWCFSDVREPKIQYYFFDDHGNVDEEDICESDIPFMKSEEKGFVPSSSVSGKFAAKQSVRG